MKKMGILLVLLLVCLAGCTKEGDESGKQEQITLTVLAGQTTADAGIEDMINDLLYEKYPNVVLDWNTVDWGNDFESMLKADFAAGEVPDIIIGKAQDVQAYYKTGNLAEIGTSLTSLVEDEVLSDVTVDDKIYGLPYNMDYQGILYNREIFEKLKLVIPKTNEELSEDVKICEANGVTPFAFCGQDATTATMNTMQLMLNEIFDEDPQWGKQFRMGEVFMDQSPEAEQCFLNNKYMFEHSWQDVSQLASYECSVRFSKGQAAMYMTSTWALGSFLQNGTEGSYGIFPYPNKDGDAKLIQETNLTFMKGADTEYGDLIDEIFETILTSETLCTEISDFTNTLPVVKGMEASYPQELQSDIDSYVENGRVVNSICGYSQLSWNYLGEITQKQLDFMRGDCTLLDVLNYANLKRADSDKLK